VPTFAKKNIKMVAAWRAVGMSYIQYSAICARMVRRALKPEFQAAALKGEATQARVIKYENGKVVEPAKKE